MKILLFDILKILFFLYLIWMFLSLPRTTTARLRNDKRTCNLVIEFLLSIENCKIRQESWCFLAIEKERKSLQSLGDTGALSWIPLNNLSNILRWEKFLITRISGSFPHLKHNVRGSTNRVFQRFKFYLFLEYTPSLGIWFLLYFL